MAPPTSQHHANLIREMSRDISRSSKSSRRSQDSVDLQPTVSDFDPENEAIMSTRQLDNNVQNLPALRASAQKYNRFTRPSRSDPVIQSEPDYAINTSAIGRAFPDFSQGGTSSDEGSMSIEVGRGARKAGSGLNTKPGRSREYSSNVQLDLDEDSLDFAAPLIGDYMVTGTPPLRHHRSSAKVSETAQDSAEHYRQARRPSALRQEIIETSHPLAKTKDYGSGESGRGSGGHGRSLAAMHARVRDENELPRNSDDRPPTIDLTVRHTRFGNAKGRQSVLAGGALPTKFSAAQGLISASNSGRKTKSHKTSTTNQGTQQSFLLPDMPNMSELVSGVFEDGTPVFSRHGKSRPTRFAKGLGHADIDEIPIPEDEQAIFLSLKLLQDKIALLERNQAENEKVIQELERKNQVLESERDQQRRRSSNRSDSALGTSDSDSEGRKLTIERNSTSHRKLNSGAFANLLAGLESSVRTLQTQLDASTRKANTAETILRTITQERDSAISQLTVAYVTIKQLQAENEDLKEENEALRGHTQRLPENHDNITKKSRKSTGHNGDQKTTLRGFHSEDSPNKSTRFARRSSGHPDLPKTSAREDAGTMFDLTPRPDEMLHNAKQQAPEDGSDESEASVHEALRTKGKGKGIAKPASSHRVKAMIEDSTRDLTYLSFLDSNEVAKLRRTLEQEHIERKQRQTYKPQPSEEEAAIIQRSQGDNRTPNTKVPLPKKSSLKDLASKSVKDTEQQDGSLHAKGASEHNRRHSETSILSTRSRRRGMNADNKTSAFILPDITIRTAAVAAQEAPELSKENRAVLEELAKHSSENCTVCKRNPNHEGPHNATVTVSKPIPVSERVSIAGPYEEEQTVRPSQPPSLALATVLKSLEDEIAHLKIQLIKYQALYNGHDPALSKRKRKSVYEKIESLLQAIDIKSDQIYALYDVLEGQKQDGREITEQETEITLQSAGIDTAGLHLRGGGAPGEGELKGKPTERHPWDLNSEGEDDDELPWEGIESTVEITKGGFAKANRRRSAA